jgi:hypothetical protein
MGRFEACRRKGLGRAKRCFRFADAGAGRGIGRYGPGAFERREKIGGFLLGGVCRRNGQDHEDEDQEYADAGNHESAHACRVMRCILLNDECEGNADLYVQSDTVAEFQRQMRETGDAAEVVRARMKIPLGTFKNGVPPLWTTLSWTLMKCSTESPCLVVMASPAVNFTTRRSTRRRMKVF